MSHHVPPRRFELLHNLCFEIGPVLEAVIGRYLSILESPIMTREEIQAYADAKAQEVIDAVSATVAAEHQEFLDALAGVGTPGGLSDEDAKAVVDTMTANFRDKLIGMIGGVVDTTGTPTPTPTPTPEPLPEPTPTPTPPTP